MEVVENIIKSIVQNGIFGDVQYLSTNFGQVEENETHFASTISFIEILVEDQGRTVTHKAVLKRSPESPQVRDVFLSEEQFQSEVLMYRSLLPLLGVHQIDAFPQMHYGNFTQGRDYTQDLLILEDLRTQGYRLSHEKVFLDVNHLSLAIEKLGEFHGLSHKAKKASNSEFKHLCSQLSKSKFESNDEQFHFMCSCSMERGIQAISNQSQELKMLLEKIQTERLKETVEKISFPEEPYAVLCHGDFNRNNMFFRYDSGQPVSVKFFDMQTSRYTSPAIDISFLLYMNTTQETRDKHWDSLLVLYWKGLTSIEPNPGFTFQQFLSHLGPRAIFGYIPSSFFLPAMMDETRERFDNFNSLTQEEMRPILLSIAGEKGTKVLEEIVTHLINKKYISAFLNLVS